jgi:hypothetical protein
VFAERAVVRAESGMEVGVNVEFTGDFAVDEDRNNDFGFGFERAGEIAGIGIDVVNDNGFAGGGRGTTDALIEGDASVRGHGAFEGAEDKHVAAFLFQHVKTNPVIAGELFVEESDNAFSRGSRARESDRPVWRA